MGKMTNKLEELTWAYLKGDEKMHQLFDDVKSFHFNIIANLFEDKKNRSMIIVEKDSNHGAIYL